MEEDAPARTRKPILLIALGGNALIRNGQKGTIAEQFANLREPARQIAKLSESYRIIITHGNGPQVGNLLLQQECCSAVPQLPLEMLVAQTEGQIGYMIESTLDEALMERGIDYRPLVTLITYVVVDQDDPSFKHPTKPIGPAYTEEIAATLPYPTVKTHKGYRRVVASPKPVTIVEKKEISHLIDSDFIVVCCGGGGIPVVRQGRAFAGVNAVIDKDLASALLACEVDADVLVITTDVPGVMLHYGTPREELIGSMSVSEALDYLEAGHFASGSMRPKVEAAVQFVQHTKKRAAITALETIEAAVEAGAATQVVLEKQ
ncbi:MAG: carbamate kinase [Syntrophobacteraceae bacterium]